MSNTHFELRGDYGAVLRTAAKRLGGRRLVSALFIGVVVLAGLALPQVLPNTPTAPEAPTNLWNSDASSLPEGPDARSMLLRLTLGTVLVLGLCIGSLWLGKRWLQVRPLPVEGERQLRLVETLPLHGRCCVYLLQVGSRQILAGADGSGLKALLPLPDSFEQTLNQAQAEA